MCMGYVQEIRAWVCDDFQRQRDEMMPSWSMAFKESTDQPKESSRLQSNSLQPLGPSLVQSMSAPNIGLITSEGVSA